MAFRQLAGANAFIPVLADLSGVLLYLLLLPRLVSAFSQPSIASALFIILVYLSFCGSVYLLRRQPPSVAPRYQDLLASTGLLFSLFVGYMVAESAGFFANVGELDSDPGPVAILAVLISGALWLALLFLYPLLLSLPIAPAEATTQAQSLLALLGVNLMILVTAAYWQATFADVEPYDDLTAGGKLLIFLAVYLFFLLFFAAPRALILLRSPASLPLISFLLQTGYYVWNSLSGNAWS